MAPSILGNNMQWIKSTKLREWDEYVRAKRHGILLAYIMVLITGENDRKVRLIIGYIRLVSTEGLFSRADSSFNASGAMSIGYCGYDSHSFN
jgi:hypothetical protein